MGASALATAALALCFGQPQAVTIEGYRGHATEPFIARGGSPYFHAKIDDLHRIFSGREKLARGGDEPRTAVRVEPVRPFILYNMHNAFAARGAASRADRHILAARSQHMHCRVRAMRLGRTRLYLSNVGVMRRVA